MFIVLNRLGGVTVDLGLKFCNPAAAVGRILELLVDTLSATVRMRQVAPSIAVFQRVLTTRTSLAIPVGVEELFADVESSGLLLLLFAFLQLPVRRRPEDGVTRLVYMQLLWTDADPLGCLRGELHRIRVAHDRPRMLHSMVLVEDHVLIRPAMDSHPCAIAPALAFACNAVLLLGTRFVAAVFAENMGI